MFCFFYQLWTFSTPSHKMNQIVYLNSLEKQTVKSINNHTFIYIFFKNDDHGMKSLIIYFKSYGVYFNLILKNAFMIRGNRLKEK